MSFTINVFIRGYKLREYRFSTQLETNSRLKHITILEEAHNILKRCSHEQSQDSGNVQGAAVGTLVDSIAEMRSSGEGFMIIDQSPGAVDEAALKNTAVKIVMRLPERGDCEAVANTMGLNEDQIKELSRLNRGCAVVYHEGWEEPVMGKMGEVWAKKKIAKIYRKMPGEVNRIDLIRTKGALCQLLCSIIDEQSFEDLKDMQRYNNFVRSFCKSNYAPSLNDNTWADLRHQFSLLVDEIRNMFGDDLEDLSSKQKALR